MIRYLTLWLMALGFLAAALQLLDIAHHRRCWKDTAGACRCYLAVALCTCTSSLCIIAPFL